jgi:poly(A) polymerase
MSPITLSEETPIIYPSEVPEIVFFLGSIFESLGVTAYLVGGTIRDIIAHKTISDIDIVVSESARKVAYDTSSKLNGKMVILNEDKDIARVIISRKGLETNLDISSYKGSIYSDLGERDFTIDAMCIPVSPSLSSIDSITVIDPNKGICDLNRRIIRQVSNKSFVKDPARLMRAPRLASQLGFDIECETANTIRRESHLIQLVPTERVRDELLKIVERPKITNSIRNLDNLDLLTKIIPEFENTKGITQPSEHHYWDVFNHSLETAGNVDRLVGKSQSSPDLVSDAIAKLPQVDKHFSEVVCDGHTRLTMLKIAGLLHDISKPETKRSDSSGKVRFIGHDIQGAEKTRNILERLRFGNKGVQMISKMVRHHLRPTQMSSGTELPSPRAVYRYYRDLGDVSLDTLFLNMADYLAAKGPDITLNGWNNHFKIINHILQDDPVSEKQPKQILPLLDGHTIMDEFALDPGPKIGTLLELVRESRASGEIGTKEEALEFLETTLASGGTSA